MEKQFHFHFHFPSFFRELTEGPDSKDIREIKESLILITNKQEKTMSFISDLITAEATEQQAIADEQTAITTAIGVIEAQLTALQADSISDADKATALANIASNTAAIKGLVLAPAPAAGASTTTTTGQ